MLLGARDDGDDDDGDCGGDAIGGEGRELAAKMLVCSNGKASTFLTSGVLWRLSPGEKGLSVGLCFFYLHG